MVIAYVAKLNELSEVRCGEQQARRGGQARSEAQAARERLAPVEDRLERLLATIPVEIQRCWRRSRSIWKSHRARQCR